MFSWRKKGILLNSSKVWGKERKSRLGEKSLPHKSLSGPKWLNNSSVSGHAEECGKSWAGEVSAYYPLSFICTFENSESSEMSFMRDFASSLEGISVCLPGSPRWETIIFSNGCFLKPISRVPKGLQKSWHSPTNHSEPATPKILQGLPIASCNPIL